MAVVSFSVSEVKAWLENAHVVAWEEIPNGDSGAPLEMPGSNVRSVQVGGTFGAGGTVVIEGSNDGTNYVTLTDPQGNAISKTSAAIEAIQEVPRYIRPRVTAGDGTTAVDVHLILVRRGR